MRLAEREAGLESAGRVVLGESLEHSEGIRNATRVDQGAPVVEGPGRTLRDARAALLVVLDGRGGPLRGVVDLAEVDVRDIVGRRVLQQRFEMTPRARTVRPASYSLMARFLRAGWNAGSSFSAYRKRGLAASFFPSPVSAMPRRLSAFRSPGVFARIRSSAWIASANSSRWTCAMAQS